MALPDLTNQYIQDTYQRVLQVAEDGTIRNGTGSLFIPPTSSFAISASYAVSASHEIIKELSSSHADVADGLTGQPNIHVTNITASSNISASGDLEATNITSNGAVTASVYANKFGSFTLGTPDDFIFIEPGGDSTIDFRSGETNFKYNDLFFKDAQDGVTVILQGSNGADNVIMEFGDPEFESTGRKLTLNIDNASAHFSGLDVTGSKHGLFQAGKPIITHTSSPISASLANAGKYHIVGGTLTASIVLDSNAPVGAEYEFFQSSSAGQFLFESASGTTVISKNGSMRLAQQGSSAVLKKVSSTTFHLMGDLT